MNCETRRKFGKVWTDGFLRRKADGRGRVISKQCSVISEGGIIVTLILSHHF